MTTFRRLEDADVNGKRVLVRVDFNAPLGDDHKVSDDTRLKAALPTINTLRERGAKVILAAHFGRPKGQPNPEMSLKYVVGDLAALLGAPVAFAQDCIGPQAEEEIAKLAPGDVLLLENTRFHAGEEKNDPAFDDALAALADVYVNDAFSAAHRAHGSTEGVARRLPAYAGLAMERELDHLNQALGDPVRPVVAVVGGAKVSSKIAVLKNLAGKVDYLVIGGAMANTFLAARGVDVGKSLVEMDQRETALDIEAAAEAAGCKLILPVDVVTAKEFKAGAAHAQKPAGDVGPDEMILDVGSMTVDLAAEAINDAKTVVWNGPLGAFEIPPFDTSTVELAKFAANQTKTAGLISVAGGGDTVAALNHAGVAEDFTFVSTAGGAFLEWMEGRELPGVEALKV
ncbi:MAG: phosphoglycerate kinase [Maricaulaceae bacterium]|jgi:phosphoglycerate kinase